MSLRRKLRYAAKVLPEAIRSGLRAPTHAPVHLIFAMADHFEPAIHSEGGLKRVAREEQERRLERWIREYPKVAERWRDHDGRPFVHTYFYPAEQYDEGLLDVLADHCHDGWGEVEVHLHHGVGRPDTAENTRHTLTEFCERLASRHGCLAVEGDSAKPRYAFVHGNYALANSNEGRGCGVDSEMKILGETGCYADFTLPAAVIHAAQVRKLNSIYECGGRLDEAIPHGSGKDLASGRVPQIFPFIVQGPLVMDFGRSLREWRLVLESSEITGDKPLTLDRLNSWKKANIHVQGRPDWLFVKLYCHGMNPDQTEVVGGEPFRKFIEELVSGANDRRETLHFVTAREMANIILAACDGRDGNPHDYRDYRFRRLADARTSTIPSHALRVALER